MTIKKQYDKVVNKYLNKFVKKHGYEFSYWVSDEVGGVAVFIEQYYFNFTDIKYDIDNKVEKGLIFKHQDDTLKYYLEVNAEETINFKDYSKGLRYEHLKEIKNLIK